MGEDHHLLQIGCGTRFEAYVALLHFFVSVGLGAEVEPNTALGKDIPQVFACSGNSTTHNDILIGQSQTRCWEIKLFRYYELYSIMKMTIGFYGSFMGNNPFWGLWPLGYWKKNWANDLPISKCICRVLFVSPALSKGFFQGFCQATQILIILKFLP